jgi:hypothetical protein
MSKVLCTPISIAGGLLAGVVGKKLFDHDARRAFSKATGTWPGEESPDRA